MTVGEFTNSALPVLERPSSVRMTRSFALPFQEQKGCMDFRQFLVGSAYLAAEASRKDVISIALKVQRQYSH